MFKPKLLPVLKVLILFKHVCANFVILTLTNTDSSTKKFTFYMLIYLLTYLPGCRNSNDPKKGTRDQNRDVDEHEPHPIEDKSATPHDDGT